MKTNTEPRGFPRGSAGFSNWHIRGPLSNRRIEKYALEGFYGKEMQQLLLAKKAKNKLAQQEVKNSIMSKRQQKKILAYLLS